MDNASCLGHVCEEICIPLYRWNIVYVTSVMQIADTSTAHPDNFPRIYVYLTIYCLLLVSTSPVAIHILSAIFWYGFDSLAFMPLWGKLTSRRVKSDWFNIEKKLYYYSSSLECSHNFPFDRNESTGKCGDDWLLR